MCVDASPRRGSRSATRSSVDRARELQREDYLRRAALRAAPRLTTKSIKPREIRK
jgi:hypothetical protein